ncbi:MAG TPA: ester cyclase [Sphingomicrobium sp.]|nr:ester cyclase [Sphingomicrobium sp.]
MVRMSALFPAALLLLLPATAYAGPAENKITASRVIIEKMGQGRFEIQPEIYGPGFIAHGFGRDYTLAEDEASGKHVRSAFPDLKVSVDRIIAEGDMVSLHWSAVGTNTVAVPGFPGEGKRVAIDGMSFFRFADGKIVEECRPTTTSRS